MKPKIESDVYISIVTDVHVFWQKGGGHKPPRKNLPDTKTPDKTPRQEPSRTKTNLFV